VRGITSFALYGFPESHAASFALIAYASSWLKCHHPAAFLAGLINAWPMGFYSPASLVQDAQRHDVTVLPIDVAHSKWLCDLETGDTNEQPHPAAAEEEKGSARTASEARSEAKPSEVGAGSSRPTQLAGARPSRDREAKPSARTPRAEDCLSTGPPSSGATVGQPPSPPGAAQQPSVRLGLRFAHGLREDTAHRIETARAERPFAHVADLAKRAQVSRADLITLAELGALASIDPTTSERRGALWQVAGIERDPRSLFAGAAPPTSDDVPLEPMSPLEETLADYRASGLSTGPHVMAHLRAALARRGVLTATALRDTPNGRFARVAGHVIVRQRPGKGVICFITLEDETGTANGILTPDLFRRFRVPLHTSPLVEIAGPVQNVDGVVHVLVKHLKGLPIREAAPKLPGSHDYR
jgi:error-prone DNA polymerase